jgi:hypothetical protein
MVGTRDHWHMRRPATGCNNAVVREKSMFAPVLALHIAAGSVALGSMWVPMLSRKGGALHRRAGWVFVAAMATVAVTAVVLAAGRLLFDTRPEAAAAGVFLLYVAVLTSAAVSAGVRVLRAKARTTAHHHWWDLGLPALLTLSSLAVAVFGVVQRQPLFMMFPLIGLLNGVSDLRYWLRPPTSRMHWWFAHMNGMLAGCIAAVTAFFVVNAGNLGLPQLAAWLLPPVGGAIGVGIWTRYYQRRFSGREAPGDTSRSAPSADRDRLARSA